MRRLTAATLFLALAVPLARADDKADAAKKLNGTYEIISVLVGGKADDGKKSVKSFTIKDGEIVIAVEGQPDQTSKFTLDPSKKPAHIDVTPKGKELTLKGIYETKDTDKGMELTLSLPLRFGPDRPKDFKGEGETDMVVKLLRKKDK